MHGTLTTWRLREGARTLGATRRRVSPWSIQRQPPAGTKAIGVERGLPLRRPQLPG